LRKRVLWRAEVLIVKQVGLEKPRIAKEHPFIIFNSPYQVLNHSRRESD